MSARAFFAMQIWNFSWIAGVGNWARSMALVPTAEGGHVDGGDAGRVGFWSRGDVERHSERDFLVFSSVLL